MRSASIDYGKRRTMWSVAAVLLVAVLGMSDAAADDGAVSMSSRKFNVSIPSQPLAGALQAFSSVTGIETLYDGVVAHARNSTAVVGTFTARDALQLLLAGTSLSARPIAQDAVTIEVARVAASVTSPALPERSAHRFYFGLIQARLARSLCRDERTRPGGYRAVLKFGIAANGDIRQPSLVGTTGDDDRDRAITRRLDGLSLGHSPPVELRQPIMIVILPQPFGGTSYCASAQEVVRSEP